MNAPTTARALIAADADARSLSSIAADMAVNAAMIALIDRRQADIERLRASLQKDWNND